MSDLSQCNCPNWKACSQAGKCLKENAPSSFAAPTGLAGHVSMPIVTEQGNRAIIKGDPNMPEATRKALAEMIDAAVKAANAGELKRPANEKVSHTAGRKPKNV